MAATTELVIMFICFAMVWWSWGIRLQEEEEDGIIEETIASFL